MRAMITFLVLGAGLMQAAESPATADTLTLEAALSRAAAAHETPQRARLAITRAQAARREARAAVLPQLTLNGSLERVSFNRRAFGAPPRSQAAGEAGVALGLFDPGAWYLLQASGAALAATRAEATELQRQLAHDVVDSYLTVLTARARQQVARRQQELATEALQAITARFAAGAASRDDQQRLELDLAVAQSVFFAAEQEATQAEAVLADLITTPLPPVLAPAPVPALPDGGVPELVELARRTRPDLAALYQRAAAARAQSASARATWLPRVQLQANVQDDTWLDAGRDDDTVDAARWSVGLGATWTLFDGGAREARQDQAHVAAAEAELERRSAIRRLGTGFAVALAVRASAQAAVATADARRALAAANLSAQQVREAQGQALTLDLLDARNQVESAAAEEIRATAAVAQAGYAIRRLAGWWPLSSTDPSDPSATERP